MTQTRHVPATAPQELELETAVHAPLLHVRLCGELDIATGRRLAAPELLLPHRVDVTSVVLDLGHLHFCDLTGLKALVRYRNAHTDLGRVVTVRQVPPKVLRVMHAADVTDLFGA